MKEAPTIASIALVTVPYFVTSHHLHLAEQMFSSVKTRYRLDRIAIVNRVRSNEDLQWLSLYCDYTELNDRNVLARAWNIGIRTALARGASHVIVANLDLLFHPWCIENLYECAQQHPEALIWSPIMWHDPETLSLARITASTSVGVNWSCFMVDRRLFEQIGEFDEEFIPAYREDTDMLYRLRMRGYNGLTCHAAVAATTERGTIKGLLGCDFSEIKDCSEILSSLRDYIFRNDERYLRKWGGEYGQEQFTTPFNAKT